MYTSTCAAVDRELVAVGGNNAKYKAISAVYKYNPTTDSWNVISNMPTARSVSLVAILHVPVLTAADNGCACAIEYGYS